ncbi:MAG TPA: PQQ-dependent sugar dehydrogenase [Casimicrobiaceae bacterium]|nr:PQQ-dependent sugar dehydrogenase [Casimicrobiaceae bacterium]
MAAIEGARRGALFTRGIHAFALLAGLIASANVGAIRLVPVITAGLSSPLYVTSAGDGTNRLFIVERGGRVRVAQPGATSSTVFLDISASVIAGNEQGLLGLAFHPAYASNGRLFVYYTRAADGAIEVAEYRRSSSNADGADAAGRVLLTIPHPRFANHNGGMVAFGSDGHLYIGVGDGGGGNDPPNNAQNLESLLGKILRIDVDTAPASATGLAYSVPPDNPFVNRAGRDEIFAYGLRNPFRFSFDRSTGQVWVGDVGQDASEEVDTPLVRGGNYGWRVYEGTSCTNNDPSLCNAASFLAPLFEYTHASGRCSITGGYVYRGSQGALPQGTYLFGDFCTGEIFAWNGSSQALLLDTAIGLASFGEDERGELYVVDIGGAVYKIASETVAASVAIEYFHQGFGHYFTTSIADEIDKLDRGVLEGWRRTGESFSVSSPGSAGLANTCRFFSAAFASKSSHFYTSFAAECESVKRDPKWFFEGEVYALALPDALGNCADAMQPLYRVYNNGQGGAPNHRYTTRLDIRGTMIAQGWIAEGIGSGIIGCVPAFR